MNTGLSHPRRNFAICLAIAVLGAVSMLSGVADMAMLGRETPSTAARVGGGLFALIMGLALTWNFWRGMRVFAAMRAGVGRIASWTVTPAEIAAFREQDRRRGAGPLVGNGWRAPKKPPAEGIEVIFSEDAVLVGGVYFALVTTGATRFSAVEMLPGRPLAIGFETEMTTFTRYPRVRMDTHSGSLRIPVPRLAQEGAKSVLAHFRDVLARRRIVNPGFYPSRIRFGLTGAPIAFAVAAGGFGLEMIGARLGIVPLIMAVAGTIIGLGCLILAAIAWKLSLEQRRRPGT